MAERPDQEIEELLRRAPRRMPSAALWERVAAAARSEPARRAPRLSWVFATAVVAAVLIAAYSHVLPRHRIHGLETRPRPSTIAASPETRRAPSPQPQAERVAAAPPVLPAQVPAARRPQDRPTPKAVVARPQQSRPLLAHAVVSAPVPQPVPPTYAKPAPAETTEAAPAPVARAAADQEDDGSYYLKVTDGDARSVVQGSVTRDQSGDVTRITLAYDATDQTVPESN